MKVKLPFEPSSLGQYAACIAMDDDAHLIRSIKMNNSEKLRLKQFFEDINFNYIPSATNFITLEFKFFVSRSTNLFIGAVGPRRDFLAKLR